MNTHSTVSFRIKSAPRILPDERSAESSALHGAFGCHDARTAFGISHFRISSADTSTAIHGPTENIRFWQWVTLQVVRVIAKCTLQCTRATSVFLYQPNSEITARKYPPDINVQPFAITHPRALLRFYKTDGYYIHKWTAFTNAK